MSAILEGYTITPVRREDIPFLITVDKTASEMFASTGLINDNALYDNVPSDAFEAAIDADHAFAVRREDGLAVGFTLTSLRGNGLYLDQISVDPAHGQQGLGRALMIKILEDAEQRDLPCVTLSTFRDLKWNGPFYATMGFKEIPAAKLEPFMIEIQDAQRPYMDVTARCFMKRKVRRPLLRRFASKMDRV